VFRARLRNLAAAAIVAALATAAPARADDPTPLRYGQAFSAERSIYSLPVHMAMRHGEFAREGLAVRQFFLPGGGEKMIDALADDTVDVTHVATPFLIEAALKGSDAVAIATEFNNPIYSLVVRPEVRSFADLKGKLIGMADEAGSIAISMRKLLAQNGVRDGDVQVRIISGTPARLGCLRRGTCDAVPLGQPQDLMAEAEGYRILGLSSDAVPPYLYTVTAARRGWAVAHKDVLVRYVRGLAAALQFIRDPANRAAVIAMIRQDTECSEEVARKALALFFEPERNVLPRRGEIDLAAFQQTIALMSAGGQLKAPLPPADRFVDLQYLRAAGID
jgi:ABC-type nitrate/sulfonate/bicarbonate transport system substrate-binding protein